MTTAVLAMAYGSPSSLEEVEPYFRSIIGGRDPSPERLAALTERYRAIGGASPLNEITARQAAALSDALGMPVEVGMKHWRPSIPTAVARLAERGVERVVGLALAPHFADMSIGGYERRVLAARDEAGAGFTLHMARSWYAERAFVAWCARALRAALEGLTDARVFFTAHSLPARILDEGDPYLDELTDSARLVAEAAGVADHEVAFQSASATGEPWLGPDVLDRLRACADEGTRAAVICPIGFTADHLEILYDIDVECAEVAASCGLTLRRTPMPNDDPAFIAALAEVVRRALVGVAA